MSKGKTQSFNEIAGYYDRFRPTYPTELVEIIAQNIQHIGEKSPIVADIGCGTGILTRLLRQHLGDAAVIIGIEPGRGMLEKAYEVTEPNGHIVYALGSAENLPLPPRTVSAITVAQAIHWFDRPRFYDESAQALLPNGVLCLIENNRDWRASPFLDEYETFLETHSPNYSRHYREVDYTVELDEHPCLVQRKRVMVEWSRQMSFDDFVGFSQSSSRVEAIVQKIGRERMIDLLTNVVARHVDADGNVQIPYKAELFIAKRIENME